MPRMEVVDRLWRLPAVEAAWTTSHGLYARVKNAHQLAHLALSTAEGVASVAVGAVAPVATRFATPLHVVDMKLCQGLDIIERKVPLVKEPPQQMYESAKELVTSAVVHTAAAAQSVNVASLKDLSWTKANEILESRYGHMALAGLDSTSLLADSYLNYYLPEPEQEEGEREGEGEEVARIHPSAECDDKVMHTAHTVGRLSNKVGRRVYRVLSYRLQSVNKQSINEYLANLTLVVQLTNYLNAINQGVEKRAASRPSE